MRDLPSAVLFACTLNSIRSPMAEGMLRHLLGHAIFVDSVGVRMGEQDPFMAQVMDEIGIDLSAHTAKRFDDLDDAFFDLVITLSPEAHHAALEMTRTMACAVEFWPTFDPTAVEGSRDAVLDAYRAVRDGLMRRIKERFQVTGWGKL